MNNLGLTMSEDKKYQVIKQVADGYKNKKRAAVKLGISVRHVNRLLKVYHEKGKAGFVHGNRSKKPKHTIPIARVYHFKKDKR
ncbi:helix-turn-helix domain-containing protein [Streptococcus sp. NLN76]|uniref:helix-turn-helix domain-containing protein n=1 Tax=Streptococcus sp. NLN76 TaxID=2822800 RepID=UPI0018AA2AFE|nr:helix-turn-helix domain-containing protein [Streptococcus sp. NLN76]MBF8970905.1 helix-turn-helix domain-containing protein [Streptococcus sp. NLN76]